MSLLTLADVEAGWHQKLIFWSGGLSALGGSPSQTIGVWNNKSLPPAGNLSIGNTANGLVPTDATLGAPAIGSFSGTGALIGADFASQNMLTVALYDRLFHAGSYSASGGLVTLSAQPSYVSRVPGGSYTGLQLFYEMAVAGTSNFTLTVTYTNQDGVTGRTTGAFAVTKYTAAVVFELPLQTGDTGIQKIESVNATGGDTGFFNIVVARPLWRSATDLGAAGAVATPWTSRTYGIDQVGMPQVYSDSCLWMTATYLGGLSPGIDAVFEIVSN